MITALIISQIVFYTILFLTQHKNFKTTIDVLRNHKHHISQTDDKIDDKIGAAIIQSEKRMKKKIDEKASKEESYKLARELRNALADKVDDKYVVAELNKKADKEVIPVRVLPSKADYSKAVKTFNKANLPKKKTINYSKEAMKMSKAMKIVMDKKKR